MANDGNFKTFAFVSIDNANDGANENQNADNRGQKAKNKVKQSCRNIHQEEIADAQYSGQNDLKHAKYNADQQQQKPLIGAQ